MDRKIFYPLQIPLVEQFLQQQRNEMTAVGWLAQSVLGTATIVDGLQCIPTVPSSLDVQILSGCIYELENIDGTAFGPLLQDTRSVIKQGINLDTTQLTLVPPVTIGQAMNYLIQASLTETDGDPLALPYVNVSNPAQPFTGPNGTGVSQNTSRKCRVLLQAKAGVPDTAGLQVDPTPDPGFVGLYSITVANGATALDSVQITKLGSAPFIFKKLPELPAWVQGGSWLAASADTGSANAIVATLSPPITSYTKGQLILVKKGNSSNTDNLTADFGGGVVSVLDATGAPIASGGAGANYVMLLAYDGANFRWINGNITNTTVNSITAVSGEGVTVGADNKVSLNFPGLTAGLPTDLDLFGFFDNEGGHHMKVTWAQLLGLISALIPSPTLKNVAPCIQVEQRRPNFGAVTVIPNRVWARRPLNTLITNQISGAAFDAASSRITLPAGSYRATFVGVCSGGGTHMTRIFNVTNNQNLGQGNSSDAWTGGNTPVTESCGIAHFVLTAPAVLELQTYATSGDGHVARMGDSEDNDIGSNYRNDGWVEIVKEA